MQKNYEIMDFKEDMSRLEQFGKEQEQYLQKKVLLINKNKYYIINKEKNVQEITPTYASSHLTKYTLALCVIDPNTYNYQTEKFNRSSEMTIDLLVHGNIKTHYFILTEYPNKNFGNSPIVNKIDNIYIQANNKKSEQLKKLNQQSLVKTSILNHFRQQLFSFKAMLCNMITNIYFLVFIIRITDTPKFPWLDWQPLILNGTYLTIMLKWFLE